jgi:hypothetical protein
MSPVPLAIGVALSLLTSVVRTRGWFATVQAACPGTSTLRYRDVLRAYFSGAGFNGLVPGRAGEAVKVAVLRRYVPEARYSTLAATLAPPAAVESGFSAAVLMWALAAGLLPVGYLGSGSSLLERHLALCLVLLPAAALVVWLVVRRLPGVVARLRRGVAIVGRPRQLLTGVVAWQAAARVIRLGALAAFVAAFSLPLTLSTVLLVMAVQGATPTLAATTTPLRAIALAYGFPHAAGHHVGAAHVTEFLIGMQAALVVTNLALSFALLALHLRTASPGRWLAETQRMVAAVRPVLRRSPA